MSDKRKVKIEMSVLMIVEVPKDWDEDMINFWLNESCHCSTNEVAQLLEEFDSLPDDKCFCHRIDSKYLGEVTTELDFYPY